MTTLGEKVLQLKTLREEKARADDGIKEYQAVLNKVPEYQEMLARKVARDNLGERVGTLEQDIRASAVEDYKTNGDKSPAPGLTIKIFKKLVYDSKEAEEWARQHTPAVFKFDARSFEKVAVELGAPVMVEEEPRAQIASELP